MAGLEFSRSLNGYIVGVFSKSNTYFRFFVAPVKYVAWFKLYFTDLFILLGGRAYKTNKANIKHEHDLIKNKHSYLLSFSGISHRHEKLNKS